MENCLFELLYNFFQASETAASSIVIGVSSSLARNVRKNKKKVENLVEEPLVLVDLRLLQDKVNHGLLDSEGVIFFDLLMNPFDLALVLLHLPT